MREFFAALNSNSKNQKQEQEQKRQHRPGKIGDREAGFSATQLAKARAQPQRASALVGDPVRSGRNDDSCVGLRKNKQEQEQGRNTGISPLRRQSAPPSVEMTFVRGGRRTCNGKSRSRSLRDDTQESRQLQKQHVSGCGFAEAAGEVEEGEGGGGVAAGVGLGEVSGLGVHLLAELGVAHDGFAPLAHEVVEFGLFAVVGLPAGGAEGGEGLGGACPYIAGPAVGRDGADEGGVVLGDGMAPKRIWGCGAGGSRCRRRWPCLWRRS